MATLKEKMTAIADSIRNKTGKSEPLTLDKMAEGVNDVYSAGQKAEQDSFWNAYQGNDPTMSYRYAGRGWASTETFRPKKDMQPTQAQGMFSNWNTGKLINLKEHLEALGVTLDFSKATTMASCFSTNTCITELGVIDCSSATNMGAIFNYCTRLKKIEKLVLPESISNYANAFANMDALEDVVIEGRFVQSFNMQWSTNLSHDSIESVINALSDTTSGLTVTLSLEAVNKAFADTDGIEGEPWVNLVLSKPNWTISLI